MKSLNRERNPNSRLPSSFFSFSSDFIKNVRNGLYTDVYFNRSREIILNFQKRYSDYDPLLLMNVFSRHKKGEAIVCGLDYSIRLIQAAAFNQVEIHALYDGDIIHPNETVMTIKGHLSDFIHLETLYLGVLARATRVATNTRKVVEAASKKDIPIMFFPARFDLYSNQYLDGYAAHLVGVLGASTQAQAEWWGSKPLGTIPHALIAFFTPGEIDGKWKNATAEATKWFARTFPDVNCISLVDFENNCPETSLEVAIEMEKNELNLWGVRLDTSGSLIDFSIINKDQLDAESKTGVCATLVHNVRDTLDSHGFTRDKVKIVVSGGFNVERINNFIENDVPFDSIGVGSSLLKNPVDFTADIVATEKDGRLFHCGKVGRPIPKDLSRLEKVI
ncbi:MAG: quinolinate phosphoribosyl transferase [Candidatus Helarchaeota archaeon]